MRVAEASIGSASGRGSYEHNGLGAYTMRSGVVGRWVGVDTNVICAVWDHAGRASVLSM